jgi:hypothetical protein
MADNLSVEERLARLEQEVEELKLKVAEQHFKGTWLEPILGSMKDFPEFEEVMRLGREECEKMDQMNEEKS